MAYKSTLSMDIKKMHQLYEGLKNKAVIQVGVFQKGNARKDKMKNSDLASIHEFGSPAHGLPARSMLKVPIFDHAAEIMAPFKGKMEAFLEKGTLVELYKLIGAKAEAVVLGAFDTGGYGKWAPLKNATIWRKIKGSVAVKSHKFWDIKAGNVGSGILIRFGELRRAFGSRVIMRFS